MNIRTNKYKFSENGNHSDDNYEDNDIDQPNDHAI